MKHSVLVTAVVLLGLAAAPGTLRAQELKAFLEVKDTCPTCPQHQFDRVKLKKGSEVLARVVAENPGFYVLERFGELRAVGHDQVASIERNATRTQAEAEANSDQILFKDNTVLCGKITVDNDEFKYFAIMVPPGNMLHYGFKSQVQVAYKSGKEVFRAPAK
jgi:hypothetical protein